MTNSTVLSRFTFLSNSKVYKFTSLIWFHSLISFNSFTYSTVSQIQYYYLISHYILFNSPTYSTMQQIQYSNLFYIISYSTVPCIHQWNKVKCLISFYIIISLNSRTYSSVSQIQYYYLLSLSYLIQQSKQYSTM